MSDEEQFINACENNDMSTVIILVNKIVNIDMGFRVACHHGHLEVVKYLTLLYQYTDIYGDNCDNHNYKLICNNSIKYGFTVACEYGHTKIVKYLTTLYQHTPYCKINIHDTNEYAFRQACRSGHLQIVQYLTTLYQHTEYNIINIHSHNEWAFIWALRFNKMNIVLYLIKLYQKTKKHVCSKKRKHTSSDLEYEICGCRNSKVRNALLTYRNQFCSLIGKSALANYDAHICVSGDSKTVFESSRTKRAPEHSETVLPFLNGGSHIFSQVDIQYTYSPINVYSPSLDYIISIYNSPKYIANIGNYVEYKKFLI